MRGITIIDYYPKLFWDNNFLIIFLIISFQIQFDGPECHIPNLSYYIAFASIFFVLAFVCLIQLVMCIIAEWQRMKAPSFLRACRVTTQKVLYFVVFLASIIRGAYFTSPVCKQVFCLKMFFIYYFNYMLLIFYRLLSRKVGLGVCCQHIIHCSWVDHRCSFVFGLKCFI